MTIQRLWRYLRGECPVKRYTCSWPGVFCEVLVSPSCTLGYVAVSGEVDKETPV